MKLSRRSVLLGGLLPGAASVLSPRGTRAHHDEIRIGLLLPLTGSSASVGRETLRGATLAVEQLNAAGGVPLGRRDRREVVLVVADTQGTVAGGVAAANSLLARGVDVFTGGFGSSLTLAAQVPIAEAGIPYLISGSSTPSVTRRTDIDTRGMFHYQEIGPYDGKIVARFLAEAARPRLAPGRNLRVAVLYQDTEFGRDTLNGLPGLGLAGYAEAHDLPLEFVALEPYPLGTTDFRLQLERVKAAAPDVVVPIALEAETTPMIRQGITEVGIRALWGPTNKAVEGPTFYRDLGELAPGTLIATYYSMWDTPRGRAGRNLDRFRGRYAVRWAELPGLYAALHYDAISILAEAFRRAGSKNPKRLRASLERLDMPALLLPVKRHRIRFDRHHEVRQTFFVTQIYREPDTGENHARIVWPDSLATGELEISTP